MAAAAADIRRAVATVTAEILSGHDPPFDPRNLALCRLRPPLRFLPILPNEILSFPFLPLPLFPRDGKIAIGISVAMRRDKYPDEDRLDRNPAMTRNIDVEHRDN